MDELIQFSLGVRKLKHKEIREVVQKSVNGFTLSTLTLYDAFLFKELEDLTKPQYSFSVLSLKIAKLRLCPISCYTGW